MKTKGEERSDKVMRNSSSVAVKERQDRPATPTVTAQSRMKVVF